VIRPADPRDRAAAESVVQEAYSIYLDRMEKPPGPTLDDYGALIAQGLVSVAEDEDSEIAAVVVLMPKADYLLLDNVAVRPDRQGQGYGFAELRLYTHEKMVENIALYTRLGFVETSRGEQAGYSRVFMTKLLG
jgi:GNAT superfamily N-acetyltransferase